jgi:hypothetical protein
MRVDFDDAVTMVTEYSAASEFPEVSQAAVEQIVHRCARIDADGYLPSAAEWTETYDVYAATATVFEVKAARVANRFDFSTDGQQLSRSQMVAQLHAQARMWRARTAGTIRKDAVYETGMFGDWFDD